MHISFATANLYQEPFEDVLEMIAAAGYDAIELDLFWERKEWAMAQHLRVVPMEQVAISNRFSTYSCPIISFLENALQGPAVMPGALKGC
ncbi:MAG: hypothetical protein JW987_12065 [Anaerolineaceae bacterium]|nr:hypothetical protein [Anaerolineaceae bacterium]